MKVGLDNNGKVTLVTGANGFVGRALCHAMLHHGWTVNAGVRRECPLPKGAKPVVVGELHGETDWANALRGVQVVIHAAARAHVIRETSATPMDEFRKVNVVGTENLGYAAAANGAKRLVFVSSIGVHGWWTQPGKPFVEKDEASPYNAYTLSKWEAEQSLVRISNETGMEVVIVRSPLVYGAGAPGNVAQMLNFLAKGIPLPFAAVKNLRSLIYVENLVDALRVCATHSNAAGQTYLVSDGQDISTPDLLKQLGAGMRMPIRIFPCPAAVLKFAGKLSGKSDQIERLLGSLQVDSDKIRRDLNWQPPYSLQQGLQATADWYRTTHL